MGTRSIIAVNTDEGNGTFPNFKGTYHHWDGYPEGVGVTLLELYKNGEMVSFKDGELVEWKSKDLNTMLDFLLMYEWSTINGRYEGRTKDIDYTHETECGAEFAYVFDKQDHTLAIYDKQFDDGNHVVEMFGTTNPDGEWNFRQLVFLKDWADSKMQAEEILKPYLISEDEWNEKWGRQ